MGERWVGLAMSEVRSVEEVEVRGGIRGGVRCVKVGEVRGVKVGEVRDGWMGRGGLKVGGIGYG